MEHEVAYCVEYDVLGEDLRNSHRLRLAAATSASTVPLAAVALFGLFAAPYAFEGFAEVVEIAHEACSRADQLLLVFIHAILLFLTAAIPSLFVFLNSLLEFLIQDFLEHTLPNILLLPNAMIIDILRQVVLLTVFTGGTDAQSLLPQAHLLLL